MTAPTIAGIASEADGVARADSIAASNDHVVRR